MIDQGIWILTGTAVFLGFFHTLVGPDHYLTGVDRDPQRQLHSVDLGYPARQPDESLLQLDRGVNRVPGVVGTDLGHTPDGHESVADVLGDTGTMVLRGRAE